MDSPKAYCKDTYDMTPEQVAKLINRSKRTVERLVNSNKDELDVLVKGNLARNEGIDQKE